jgi:hypothetical protein
MKVHVEPLPECRWADIEKGVYARLDAGAAQRRSRLPLLAVAAALILASVAVFLMTRPHPHATDVAVAPTATIPSELRVGDSTLTLGLGAQVEVKGTDDTGFTIVMDRGAVDFAVAPRKSRPPFTVSTPGVRIEVVGTHFHVDVDARQTTVQVTEGVVHVVTASSDASVRAGEQWSSLTAPDVDAGVAPPPSTTTSSAPVHASSAAPPNMRAKFELAESLERSDPARASALYAAIVASNDATWAENALFAGARLEGQSNHKETARRLLSQYIARYPRGANRADAQQLLDGLGP